MEVLVNFSFKQLFYHTYQMTSNDLKEKTQNIVNAIPSKEMQHCDQRAPLSNPKWSQ